MELWEWLAIFLPVVIPLLGVIAFFLQRSNNPLAKEMAEYLLRLQEILSNSQLTQEEKLANIDLLERRYAGVIAKAQTVKMGTNALRRDVQLQQDRTLAEVRSLKAQIGRISGVPQDPKPPQQE